MRHLLLVAFVSYFAGCGVAELALHVARAHTRAPGVTEVDHYR